MLSTLTLASPEAFALIAGFALLSVGSMSLIAFVLRRKLQLRGVMALHMLNLMVVLLSLLALYQPKGLLFGGIAMALLVGLLRAMSKFENTDKQ